MTITLPLDNELPRTVAALLRQHGFTLSELAVTKTDTLILAEDPLFVLGIGCTATVADLIEFHPQASAALLELAGARNLGAKQWDVYLALLTAEEVPEDGRSFRQLAEINHDTRGLRRIARGHVQPDVDSIEVALRTFLPPPERLEASGVVDPLEELREELVSRGVVSSDASRAINVFRQTGALQDA